MPANTKKKIFISYRVKDTQAAAGRLADALKRNFDEDQIFMDIDKIEAGLEFSAVITKYLGASDVMLVIIGPDWMGYNSETGTYRIHEKSDWVKTEIATALRRKIRVIPVLLEGGQLPAEELLPEELKPLLSRQTYEISNKRWQYDSEQLILLLKKIITPKPIVPSPVQKASGNTRIKWPLIFGCLFIVAFFGIKMYLRSNKDVNKAPVVLSSASHRLRPIENVAVGSIYKNIAGKWYNVPKKVLYVISQNGKTLSIKAYNNELNLVESDLGLLMGVGSGSIEQNSVRFSITIKKGNSSYEYPIKATLTDDGKELNGSANFSNSGNAYYEKVQLQKQE